MQSTLFWHIVSETNDVKDGREKKGGGRGEERYQKDPLKARKEEVFVEFVSRQLVFVRQVEVISSLSKRIQQPKVRRLRRHQLAIVPAKHRTSYQVGHCLIFDAASHTARRSGLFDACFVSIGKNPNGVIWVAEDPEVIATGVGEFLEVGLVDTRAMQGVDKFVWRKWHFWGFCRSRRGGQQNATKKRIQGPMRMWKGDRFTRGSLPNFRPRWNRSEGRKRRRRVELEQDHEQIDNEQSRRNFARFFVGIKKGDELRKGSWAGAS